MHNLRLSLDFLSKKINVLAEDHEDLMKSLARLF